MEPNVYHKVEDSELDKGREKDSNQPNYQPTMIISDLLSDEDFYKAVQKKIVSTPGLKPAKHHGRYPKWIRRFKAGHSISQIAKHSSSDSSTVREALYAADLKDYPASVKEETAKKWITLYFVEDKTQSEIASDYPITARTVGRVVRGVIQRFFLEENYSEEDFEAEGFTEEEKKALREKVKNSGKKTSPNKTKSEEEIAKEWKSKNGELGPNGRNVTARVKETTAV